MLGAIAGDIIGSVYEWRPLKKTDFPLFQAGSRFTDDSVLTVALAISLGGDSDTMACIAGAIAEAFYGGVPDTIAHETRQRLPADLLTIVDQFQQQFIH